jgi:hypothetical protein
MMRNKKDKPVNYLSHAHFKKWIQIKGFLYLTRAASSKMSAKKHEKHFSIFVCQNVPKINRHPIPAIFFCFRP